jgi:hypothetical protein
LNNSNPGGGNYQELLMENIPTGIEKTEVEDALPPEVERRLVLRLLGHWRPLCGGRDFPARADLDPSLMPDMWPHCFILDVADGAGEPRFRTLGEAIAATQRPSPVGKAVSEIPRDSLLGVAVAYVDEVLSKRVPVSRGDEFVSAAGTRILYRSILLPMSDDGLTINAILGAVNCRELPGRE